MNEVYSSLLPIDGEVPIINSFLKTNYSTIISIIEQDYAPVATIVFDSGNDFLFSNDTVNNIRFEPSPDYDKMFREVVNRIYLLDKKVDKVLKK